MGIASFRLQTISGCYCLFDVRALTAELRVGLLRGAVSMKPLSFKEPLFGAPVGQDHGSLIMTSYTKGFVGDYVQPTPPQMQAVRCTFGKQPRVGNAPSGPQNS